MKVKFLLGPAGSGKTTRCLTEARDRLAAAPDGLPLLFIAPKQATYQLERQLLSDSNLHGYTRLHILSFERLGHFLLEDLRQPMPQILDETGRVMALRALLYRHREELRVYHSSAKMTGFANHLRMVLDEFHQCRLTPAKLRRAAQDFDRASEGGLRAKMEDLALLLERYEQWLKQRQLAGAEQIMELATEALSVRAATTTNQPSTLFEYVWMDGVAKLTPQERHILAALARASQGMTLAFCLDQPPAPGQPFQSINATIGDTFRRCRDSFTPLNEIEIETETLARSVSRGRYQSAPVLAHIEREWESGLAFPASPHEPGHHLSSLRIVECADPEAEARTAAREILRFVRDRNGRFRDAAVLVRALEGYAESVQRVFTQFGIPHFVDRREPISHHPAAELIRGSLRLATQGWEHEDWFALLKTGLAGLGEDEIDALENQALELGLDGAFWRGEREIAAAPVLAEPRNRVASPFLKFISALQAPTGVVSGGCLVASIRQLWAGLNASQQLEAWNKAAQQRDELEAMAAVHTGVEQQIQRLLASVELAFAEDALPPVEWLGIIEAGLANLSVGVLPPSLDQVIVGSIDRSRNPELRLAVVLGANETVFPAAPARHSLLSDVERRVLAASGLDLGGGLLEAIGLERYLGYIAMTRARDRLVVTFADTDAAGRRLQPSLLIAQLRRLVPMAAIETEEAVSAWWNAEHLGELEDQLGVLDARQLPASEHGLLEAACKLPRIAALRQWQESVDAALAMRSIGPDAAAALYGARLRVPPAAIEDFGKCPFKFFASRGLRVRERRIFEPDDRLRGQFQHEVLRLFQLEIQSEQRRWREVTPAEGRERTRRIALELLPSFAGGAHVSSPLARCRAELLVAELERVVATLLQWAPQYTFEPAAAEATFGMDDTAAESSWQLDLGDGRALIPRGRIDRLDLGLCQETGEMLVAVVDYKSGRRELNKTRLEHGLELQLPAYLLAAAQAPAIAALLRQHSPRPAGMFYVPLRGGGSPQDERDTDSESTQHARSKLCQHRGRFDSSLLALFDNRGLTKGDQFQYSITQQGAMAKNSVDAMEAGAFRRLLEQAEQWLRQRAMAALDGAAEADPCRVGKQTACDECEFLALCRFDRLTQPFRVLRPAPPVPAKAIEASPPTAAAPAP